MKKITFDEYLEALDPKDPSKVKDTITSTSRRPREAPLRS